MITSGFRFNLNAEGHVILERQVAKKKYSPYSDIEYEWKPAAVPDLQDFFAGMVQPQPITTPPFKEYS